jgi:PAS domain-containing protein
MKKPEKKKLQKRSDADDAEYKKAISKLHKSKQRFRIIFENSLAVMWLINPETSKIVAANRAAKKFYGWSRAELERMRINDAASDNLNVNSDSRQRIAAFVIWFAKSISTFDKQTFRFDCNFI